MAGYSTNGLTVGTGTDLNATPLIAVDTNALGGASPQQVAIKPGTQPLFSVAVTAFAGGGQTNAVALGYGVNVVTVVATAADSVRLPVCYPGAMVFVKNADSADSMTVYGAGIDTIDSVATATGVAQAAGKGKLYFGTTTATAIVGANWVSLLGA